MEKSIIFYATELPDWNKIPNIVLKTMSENNHSNVESFAQICYNDNTLFVHMWANESSIRAEVNDLFSQVCEDSCLEFFFRPDMNDLRYFNIEVNPNGCYFLGFGSSFKDLIRLYPLAQPFDIVTNRYHGGWEVELTIPFRFIQQFFPTFSPSPGDCMFANFYKCGDLTPIPHYLCWNITPKIQHGFHSPQHFGLLKFGDKSTL